MRQKDVRRDISLSEEVEVTADSRANAVFDSCADLVRQQLGDGASDCDSCTVILFNNTADTVLENRRFGNNLLREMKRIRNSTRACDPTEYRVGLAEARDRCNTTTPKAHTVVFLSDGVPGDVHFNSSTEGLLYDLLDSFSLSCNPGTFTLHTIGLGPDGSEFIWLRKDGGGSGDISSSVTKLRSSSGLSGLTSTMAVASLKPDQDDDGGPPRTEVLLGDLLTWDAVTGQHEVTMRGVRLELHHPHFARGGSRLAYRARWLTPLPRLAPAGSRPSGLELAPAGSQPQTCLMKPGQVVIAKEHRHKKDQCMYDAMCLGMVKTFAASFPGPPVTFIDCQLFRCIDNGQLRYLSVEEELVGPYCKHNGNNGYVAPRPDAFENATDGQGSAQNTPSTLFGPARLLAFKAALAGALLDPFYYLTAAGGVASAAAATFELAQAFSHWSWVHSSGQYLVCDIQGVGGRWTDVQVNSRARVFGQADMGSQGITKFFESHRCHQACRSLRLSSSWPVEAGRGGVGKAGRARRGGAGKAGRGGAGQGEAGRARRGGQGGAGPGKARRGRAERGGAGRASDNVVPFLVLDTAWAIHSLSTPPKAPGLGMVVIERWGVGREADQGPGVAGQGPQRRSLQHRVVASTGPDPPPAHGSTSLERPQPPCSQEATQPAASELGLSTAPPAKHTKRVKIE
ncbi:hypothetical protein QJQ45_005270 [Haematococcus lacustris]|nr:hypothetical protein QJQ45_005270 [Haematococcus lacustris]